ncbi:MAG: hypothetical protein HY372_00900 [Candidatus Andersenbacteria bacterium]|nr:hypothetical protein [Candidatus Andersenbacteria bacterium]
MSRKRILLLITSTAAVAALGGAAAAGWYGTGIEQTLRVAGRDQWEWHRRIGGAVTATQTFNQPADSLAEVGVLIVDMQPRGEEVPIKLAVRDGRNGKVLRTAAVSSALVHDDTYLNFTFEPLTAIRDRPLALVISVPDSEPPHYAVRISEGDELAGGHLTYKDGQLAEQDMAFTTYHVVPQYRLWWLTWRHVRTRAKLLAATVALAAGGAGLLAAAVQRGRRARQLLLVGLLILAAATRIPALQQLHGEVGGDAYYNLTLAHSLLHGRNVFKDDIQRVPGYPALLVPAFFIPGIPDFLWGRLINVAATLGTIGLLFPLARRLALRPAVAAVAAGLIIGNKDFFITSLRPLPYAVYTLELLASIVLCLTVRKWWHYAAWGTLLGVTAMTRQEGFIAGAMLALAHAGYLWRSRQHLALSWRVLWWRLALVAMPAVLITTPYFVNNWLTFGNPFYSAYFLERDDISTPHSWTEFREENLVKMWGLFSSTWRHIEERDILLGREGPFKYFLTVTALIWLGSVLAFRLVGQEKFKLWRPWARWVRTAASLALAAGLAVVAFDWAWRRGPSLTEELNMIAVAVMLLGLLELGRVGRWAGGLVVIIIMAQFLTGTWFDPHMKHYHQILPLLALGMAAVALPVFGVAADRRQVQPQRSLARQTALVLPLTLALALMFVRVHDKLELSIDRVNFQAARIYVLMAAEEYLEHTKGAVALELQEDYGLPYYIEGRMNFFTEEQAAAEQQWLWLTQRNARYLIDASEMNTLSVQDDPAYRQRFELLREFRQHEKSGYAQWTKVYRLRS